MGKLTPTFNDFARLKCCCCIELRRGCVLIGVVNAIFSACTIILTAIETVGLKKCKGCEYNSWNFAYAYSISGCIYCCLLFMANLWFIWGVLKEKKTVVMAWVVLAGIWLVQSACVFLILMLETGNEGSPIAWVVLLVLGIFFFLTLAYFMVVVYGYGLQLREKAAAARAKGPEIN